MNIYCETWEDDNGYRIDIAWTWYEMKKMPYVYHYEKRKNIFEEYRFDYKHACRINEWFFDKECKIRIGED